MVGKSRESRRIAILISALLLLTTLAAVFFFRRDDERPVVKNRASVETPAVVNKRSEATPLHDAGFAGSQACIGCHSEISNAYQSHPMANSIAAATGFPEGTASSARIFPGDVREYEVSVQHGQMVHSETMRDNAGETIYSQAVPMDYVVGSGRRAYAFLSQQGSLLFQSPLNWYSQSGKWDLAPGYQPDDDRRFRRRITDDCLSCHAGQVASAGRGQNRYQEPALVEMSIGCERCHGPGADHIRFRESAGNPLQGGDPIVNPAQLDFAERESVCNQCHLQPAARVLRYGRGEFDFRPGAKFEDFWSALDTGVEVAEDGRTKAVNHVQQMRDSRCYIKSEGQLGCISCHDPHRLPPEQEKTVFFRQLCLTCHTDSSCKETLPNRQASEDSCIACHMPAREANNVAHVSQTDHRVLRVPSESDLSVVKQTGSEPSLQLRFFDDAHQRLPEWERNRAIGIGLWATLTKKGYGTPASLADLLKPGLAIHPDDGLTLATLGALAMQHQNGVAAETYLLKAQALPESEESAVAGLLELSYQAADWPRALQYVNRCIELDPGHPGYHAIMADSLMNSGKLKEAIKAAEKSVELDPTRIPVRLWLARAYDKDGRSAEAAAMRYAVQQIQSVQSAQSPSE